jgi:YfiH family protein
VEILTSKLLGAFPHGFTTRLGGVSRAPFDTFNLGGSVGDDPVAVAENWRRLERQTGLGFARVKQVHGARVVVAAAAEAPREEADAVVTVRSGVAACVSVADCVPVLLAHPASGAVAAVHAGWRGTLARAAEAGARALADAAGARTPDLVAAVGPAIGPCCYEVSPDLAARFRSEIAPGVVRTASGTPHLDLWSANEIILRAAGLRPERVEVLSRCTSCGREMFFSHRRDEGRTGRQVAYISPPLP